MQKLRLTFSNLHLCSDCIAGCSCFLRDLNGLDSRSTQLPGLELLGSPAQDGYGGMQAPPVLEGGGLKEANNYTHVINVDGSRLSISMSERLCSYVPATISC